MRDIVPIAASRINLAVTISAGTQSTYYGLAALLGLAATQPNCFVGTAVQVTSPNVGTGAKIDLGFGSDTSLVALPDWKDATGYEVPNGLAFIRAAAAK